MPTKLEKFLGFWKNKLLRESSWGVTHWDTGSENLQWARGTLEIGGILQTELGVPEDCKWPAGQDLPTPVTELSSPFTSEE